MASTFIHAFAGHKIRVALLDLNGTLYVEDNPTPWAIQALKKLKYCVEDILFVTNNSKESTVSQSMKLKKMGFEDIITIEPNKVSLSSERLTSYDTSENSSFVTNDEWKRNFDFTTRIRSPITHNILHEDDDDNAQSTADDTGISSIYDESDEISRRKFYIFSSLSSCARICEREGLRPFLYLNSSAMEEFSSISQENKNAIVIGLAPQYFNYDDLNTVFRNLMRNSQVQNCEKNSEGEISTDKRQYINCRNTNFTTHGEIDATYRNKHRRCRMQECEDVEMRLLAINCSRYYQTSSGLSIGPGAFIKGLEYATGVKAECVGKPSSIFYDEAKTFLERKNKTKYRNDEILMIGDDWKDDCIGAYFYGFNSVLLRRGKYCRNDEKRFFSAASLINETKRADESKYNQRKSQQGWEIDGKRQMTIFDFLNSSELQTIAGKNYENHENMNVEGCATLDNLMEVAHFVETING